MTILEGWLKGEKRRSRHSNEVFLTRKERRMFDRQFLSKRERRRFPSPARAGKVMRRSKSIRESNTKGNN